MVMLLDVKWMNCSSPTACWDGLHSPYSFFLIWVFFEDVAGQSFLICCLFFLKVKVSVAAIFLNYLLKHMARYSWFHSSLYQMFCRIFTWGAHTHTRNVHDFLCCQDKFDSMSLNIRIDGYYSNSNLLLCGLLLPQNAFFGEKIPCQPDVKSSFSLCFLLSVYHCPSPHPSCTVFVAALEPEEGPDYVRIKKKRLDPLAFQRAPNQKGPCGGWLPFSVSTSVVLCETLEAHVYCS